MDRAFLEAGFGLNNTLRRNTTANMDWGHFGFNGRVAFGDWLTPEHGFRIGLEGNIFRRTGISNKAKAYGISADYLMNLSAIASRNYEYPRTFEVIGTAGFDILRSHMDGEVKWASGLHLGLRGQVTYLIILTSILSRASPSSMTTSFIAKAGSVGAPRPVFRPAWATALCQAPA